MEIRFKSGTRRRPDNFDTKTYAFKTKTSKLYLSNTFDLHDQFGLTIRYIKRKNAFYKKNTPSVTIIEHI